MEKKSRNIIVTGAGIMIADAIITLIVGYIFKLMGYFLGISFYTWGLLVGLIIMSYGFGRAKILG